MKINHWQKMAAALATTSLLFSATMAMAQEALSAAAAQPVAANQPAPPLGYGTSQILQLAQAKLGEATLIAYIRNSGNSYNLNADQIIYLRQQGLSDAVISAMLNQPRAGVALPLPSTPAPAPVAYSAYAAPASTATVAPAATYVQTAPETTYYAQPYYAQSYYSQPYYYNPYYYSPGYAWYPSVAVGWGWGWGGRGYYGGYSGGWGGYGGGRHGGGFGGGGHGGGHGGGFGGGGHGGGHR